MSVLQGIKIALISLGCDKNLVDSEVALGQLAQNGALFTNNQAEAAVIIINTCGFLQDAVDEARQAILEAVELKRKSCRAVIVTGCYAQRYADKIMDEFDVDGIAGVGEYDKISQIVASAMQESGGVFVARQSFDESLYTGRILSTPHHYAYLKIAEGCDNFCTYCTIPKIRGPYRSRSMESLLDEARVLVASGVKELILIAQDTALYGVDNYGKQRLHELLAELAKIEGIRWMRLMYCYPEHITDELIAEMARNDRVVPYLDMPVQHASDKILKLMGRKSTQAGILAAIGKLRADIPQITLRTTLITGFPQESKEDFVALLHFIEAVEFDRLGVFVYSPEEGTPAALLDGQIPKKTAINRQARLMETQMRISSEKLKNKAGMVLNVIIEREDDGMYYGRSHADAPDIDGLVYVKSPALLEIGGITPVKITDSTDHDLIGDAINEFGK